MKLNEIIVSGIDIGKMHIPAPLIHKLETESNQISSITSTLTLAKQDAYYVLLKDKKLVAFVQLGDSPVELFGKKYDEIKMIYAAESIRKTYAIGAFLIALRKKLSHPLILGSDSYGGVLFKNGQELVKRLKTSAIADVKMLDMRNGQLRDVTDTDLEQGVSSKHLTLVFEEDDFPLEHESALGKIYLLEGCEKSIS